MFLPSQKSKCQDLPKSELGGCSCQVKSQSAKICLNLNWGGGCSCQVKSQSAKIWPTFHFQGGRAVLYQIPEKGVLLSI